MVTPAHDPGRQWRRADSYRPPCTFLPPGLGPVVLRRSHPDGTGYRRSHAGLACPAFATNTKQPGHPAPARPTGPFDRNVPVSPAGLQTRVSRVRAHARRARPEHAKAGRSAGPAAGRAPGRPPTLEPAPLIPAHPHVTATVASSFTAADS